MPVAARAASQSRTPSESSATATATESSSSRPSRARSKGQSSLASGLDLAFAAPLPAPTRERPATEVPFPERARCELYKLVRYTWPNIAGKDPKLRHTHILEAVYRLVSCNSRDAPVFQEQFASKFSPVGGVEWLLEVWEQFAGVEEAAEAADGAEGLKELDNKFSERYWVLAIAGRLIGTSPLACKEITNHVHKGVKGYFIFDGPVAQGMQPAADRHLYRCAMSCFDAWCFAMEQEWIPPLAPRDVSKLSRLLKVSQRGRSRSESSATTSTSSDSSGIRTGAARTARPSRADRPGRPAERSAEKAGGHSLGRASRGQG